MALGGKPAPAAEGVGVEPGGKGLASHQLRQEHGPRTQPGLHGDCGQAWL